MAVEAGKTAKFEVTATRRRPKTLDELAGQEFVVSTLKNSLDSRTIAHAYLFSGPRGCGKTSAARILARSLNCEKGPSSHPCGVCANCREIAAGSSLDVIEIDGASNTSVNDVRQIKDEVLFPPQSGTYKVYIIDEVHMLSTSAFNALLKTIEEPPHYIVFIFATTELHKVPATIKSRCQQFAFRLIPIETIKGILKDVCGEMKIEAEDEALFWMARESTGSLRDAFTLFDQVASFSAGHIRTETIREKLGLVGLERLNELAEACVEGDAARGFDLFDRILSSGVAIEQFVIDLAGYYRSLLLLKNSVTRESLLGYPVERFSGKVLGGLDSERLEQALELLLDCYRDIKYSVSPRFELETVVSKLSWLKSWVPPAELRAAVEDARRALGGGGLERPLAGREAPAPAELPVKATETGPIPSLSEEFRRRMAAREAQGSQGAAGLQGPGPVPVPQSGGGGFSRSDADPGTGDEDVPMWSTLNRNGRNGVTPAEEPAPNPLTQRVLRIFRGTVVERGEAERGEAERGEIEYKPF
ncbi:MAG: DNA polymerase III subunit gamma/tau [Treponema sp.]|jgi:DNA polymerase-3 subunit gamma/tau|nr:DNA polymerase III subunit gamma/tau [Treponema sp.]